MFENPFIEDKSFAVVDDDSFVDLKSDKAFDVIGDDSFVDLKSGKAFDVIGDDSFNDLKTDDFEGFHAPIIEGNVLDCDSIGLGIIEEDVLNCDGFELGIHNKDPFLDIFDMEVGESREISLEELFNILSQNQDDLSFTLNPAFPDESDINDEEVSLEEFIAHIIGNGSKAMGFGIIEDDDLFN